MLKFQKNKDKKKNLKIARGEKKIQQEFIQ